MENKEEIVELAINENKLRKWLKNYGASEQEIENFIQDLKDDVEEAIEEKEEEFDKDLDWEEYLKK